MVPATGFGSSSDVYNWISRFINLGSGQTSRSFKLDRMADLAALAGRPERGLPIIHSAGSKGKGSVTGMIASALDAWGLKTALYASPNVSDFRERISLAGRFFDEEVYVKAGDELRKVTESLGGSKLFDPKVEGGEEPAFFELMTLWFFLCARAGNCEVLAVETGMGGRLDATNIVDPALSVITAIELEHTEYLGSTIAAIAAEKAGIIKRKKPTVLAEQTPEALKVFKARAAEMESLLLYFPDLMEINNINVTLDGTSFDLTLKQSVETMPGLAAPFSLRLSTPMIGKVQAANAGLAVLALKAAFPGIGNAAIKNGLASFSLPARFEKIPAPGPAFIIDGAHTVRSAAYCAETFEHLFGKGGVLLFGCAASKDARAMARALAPCFSRVIITTPGAFKKSAPAEVYEIFRDEAAALSAGPEVLFIPDTPAAVDRALALSAGQNLPVLTAGSFYLAAEVRERVL